MILRFIAFLLLVYLVVYFLRSVFVKPFRQGFDQADSRQKRDAQGKRNTREGDISITYDPRKHQRNNDGVGEYVDYEEVKD